MTLILLWTEIFVCWKKSDRSYRSELHSWNTLLIFPCVWAA